MMISVNRYRMPSRTPSPGPSSAPWMAFPHPGGNARRSKYDRRLPHHEIPNRSFMAGVLPEGSPGNRSTRVVNTRRNDSAVDSSVRASTRAPGNNGCMSSKRRGWASLANMRFWACAREMVCRYRSCGLRFSRTLEAEWEEQIAKFSDLPSTIVSSSHPARLATYRRLTFFTLCNYEQVVSDGNVLLDELRPDVVILDEAQRIKNWQTKTANAVKKLQSRYAFVLTGTPLENRIDEIYSIVQFLDPDLLGPLFRFNREFYELDAKGKPSGFRNLDELAEAGLLGDAPAAQTRLVSVRRRRRIVSGASRGSRARRCPQSRPEGGRGTGR